MKKRIAWNKDLPAPWAKNLPQRFKKGQTPWNKNLKGYMAGEKNNKWKGGPIEIKCQYCEKIFKNFPSNYRKYCSGKCSSNASIGRISSLRGIPRLEMRGKNHPRYNGNGRHDPDRKRIEAIIWRTRIFERDNWICQSCGEKEKLNAHHIKTWDKYPELRYEVNNGITLCRKCHQPTLFIEEQYEKYFEELLQKAVNSGEPLTDKAEGNPEPSLDSNILEGATHRAEILMG